MLDVQEYDTSRLSATEKEVAEAIKAGKFDINKALSLLRLYNLLPDQMDLKLVGSILIQALLRLPEPDFNLAMLLIPERMQEEQPLSALLAVSQHLEAGRYREFWQAVDACSDILASEPQFQDKMRRQILERLCKTYKRVGQNVLASCLHTDGSKLDSLIQQEVEEHGWTVSAGGSERIITLPRNSHNQLRPATAQGGAFEMDQLASLLTTARG